MEVTLPNLELVRVSPRRLGSIDKFSIYDLHDIMTACPKATAQSSPSLFQNGNLVFQGKAGFHSSNDSFYIVSSSTPRMFRLITSCLHAHHYLGRMDCSNDIHHRCYHCVFLAGEQASSMVYQSKHLTWSLTKTLSDSHIEARTAMWVSSLSLLS